MNLVADILTNYPFLVFLGIGLVVFLGSYLDSIDKDDDDSYS